VRQHLTGAARLVPTPLLVACALVAGFARGASAPLLEVSGDTYRQLALGAADLSALPRAKVSVSDEHGTRVVYEGVPAREILQRAGAPLGKELRGPNMTMCVVAGGSDGYQSDRAQRPAPSPLGSIADNFEAQERTLETLSDARSGEPQFPAAA
jgi:hypothetical protein